MNIGFVSATGNLGKSTLLLNLIVSMGKKVKKEFINNPSEIIKIIDSDQLQTTLSDVMNIRKENGLSNFDVIVDNDEIMKTLNENYNNKQSMVFVDIQGFIDERTGTIIDKLDLIIMVNSNEVLVNNKTIRLYLDLKESGYDNVKVVLNRIRKSGLSYEDLKEQYGNDLMVSIIQDREGYSKIYEDGSLEYDRFLKGIIGLYRIKDEINCLKDEIWKTLSKL